MENTNTLLIFGHPNPDSFNGALLKTIENKLIEKGYSYITKNLYQLNFNPVLSMNDHARMSNSTVADDVAIEHGDIQWAKNLIFIYPIWWAGQPAIVKGWIDRVLNKGFAYAPQEDGTVKGLLTDKRVLVITTSGTDEDEAKKTGIFAAIEQVTIEGIFKFCGINDVLYKNLYKVPTATEDEKNKMLMEVEALINNL